MLIWVYKAESDIPNLEELIEKSNKLDKLVEVNYMNSGSIKNSNEENCSLHMGNNPNDNLDRKNSAVSHDNLMSIVNEDCNGNIVRIGSKSSNVNGQVQKDKGDAKKEGVFEAPMEVDFFMTKSTERCDLNEVENFDRSGDDKQIPVIGNGVNENSGKKDLVQALDESADVVKKNTGSNDHLKSSLENSKRFTEKKDLEEIVKVAGESDRA